MIPKIFGQLIKIKILNFYLNLTRYPLAQKLPLSLLWFGFISNPRKGNCPESRRFRTQLSLDCVLSYRCHAFLHPAPEPTK